MIGAGINPDYDCLLDTQQAAPAGWCPVCGREIYADGQEVCRRCREEAENV